MEPQTTHQPPQARRRLPGAATRLVILSLLAVFVVAGSAIGRARGAEDLGTTRSEAAPTGFDSTGAPSMPEPTSEAALAAPPDLAEIAPGTTDPGLEPEADGGAAFIALDTTRPSEAVASAPDTGQTEAGAVVAACGEPDEAASPVAETDPTLAAPGPWYGDTFEGDAANWQPLSGTWVTQDGRYLQRDTAGYDLIAELRVDPPPEYRVGVDIVAAGDGLGAGLVVGQPIPGSRAGAVVIDFTDGGSFLRWGSYDPADGQYRYIGGVVMAETFVTDARHRLEVEVRTTRTVIAVDGAEVGAFDPVGFGRIGLVTSVSSVGFDDFAIEEIR